MFDNINTPSSESLDKFPVSIVIIIKGAGVVPASSF
jgi:hypothetical protein